MSILRPAILHLDLVLMQTGSFPTANRQTQTEVVEPLLQFSYKIFSLARRLPDKHADGQATDEQISRLRGVTESETITARPVRRASASSCSPMPKENTPARAFSFLARTWSGDL
jgi:hypothetical protein